MTCSIGGGYQRFGETYRFQSTITSTLKMVAIRSSETSVKTYKTTQLHKPENHNPKMSYLLRQVISIQIHLYKFFWN
jgi:hypothetical protein